MIGVAVSAVAVVAQQHVCAIFDEDRCQTLGGFLDLCPNKPPDTSSIT